MRSAGGPASPADGPPGVDKGERNHSHRPHVQPAVSATLALLLILTACGDGQVDDVQAGDELPPSVVKCLGADASAPRIGAFEGLRVADAHARADSEGLTLRIIGRGDECLPRLSDSVANRVNVWIGRDEKVLYAARF